MTGIIMKLKFRTDQEKGGYGFIRDAQGRDRFFHANDLRDEHDRAVPGLFAHLREGERVTFEPRDMSAGKGNGLRAELVKLCA